MKKLFALLLVLVMVASLSACGKDKETNYFGGNQGLDIGGGNAQVILPYRGVVINNTYTSDYSGLKLTVPSSWRFYTDEELAQTMGMVVDTTNANWFKEQLEENGNFYDMMVLDPATGTNISIMYEKTSVDVNTYMNSLEFQLGNAGYTFGQSGKTMLGARDFDYMTCYISVSGVDMEQRYYCRDMGDYIHGVIVTLVQTDAQTVENMFS